MNTFAVETDTAIAAAFDTLTTLKQKLEWAEYSVRKAAGQNKRYDTGWNGTLDDAVATVEVHRANGGGYLRGYDANQIVSDLSAGRLLHQDAVAKYNALNDLYTGWNRFFIVRNANGHVHSSMNCSTCFITTVFGWLPQLSGLTEAEAVADQGEILCSICFPSAPVAWTTGVSKASQEAAEARKAKSAAIAAKKAEKALGTVLRIGKWNDRIETIAAAKTWLTDAAVWGTDHPSYTHADVVLVSETLAARLGTDATSEWSAAQVRAAKRK